MNTQIFGRLRVIKELVSKSEGISLSIGCKETRFGDINVDIDPIAKPDVVTDALNLPFKDSIFDLIYFTDVIEHLPENTEIQALKEIYRVMKPEGYLILTTPNDKPIYTYLDPAKYVIGHRHYKIKDIQKMIKTGFKVEKIFTAGGFWDLAGILWYYFVIYPLKKISGVNLPYNPKILLNKTDKEYNLRKKEGGYTIFVIARKIQ